MSSWSVERGLNLLDLEVVSKINEVEKKTGTSLPKLLSSVPFTTVVTAFKYISVGDLIDMVCSVPLDKLIHGLQIITLDEIKEVPVTKLKVVLKYGNMLMVSKLNDRFGSWVIISALNKLSEDEISKLLAEDNIDVISKVISDLVIVSSNKGK